MVEANPAQNDGIIPLGLPIDQPPLYRRHSSVDGGGSRHTFKVIYGNISKKRACVVDNQETRDRARREQEDNRHEV